VGGPEKFEPFIKAYFYELFMHQFMSFFLSHFSFNPSISSIDWATWLYAPGMPPYKPDFDASLAVKSRQLSDKWIAGEILEDREEFEQFSAGIR
jgi:leukotriene-A4 hydrolase